MMRMIDQLVYRENISMYDIKPGTTLAVKYECKSETSSHRSL